MKLSRENYTSILNMLNSTDEENHLVGLTCVEEADFKKNFVVIMFLFKDSNLGGDAWKEHAPKTHKKIIKITGGEYKSATFKIIFDNLIKTKPVTEDVAFYIQQFNNFLIDMVNKGGRFPEIEKIEIKLKDLNYEDRPVSQG